jgi:hypothetical protein
MLLRSCLAWLSLGAICSLAGCGGPPEDPGVKVTGSLTRGGTGVGGVTIGFVATNQKNQISKGAITDPAGKFEVKLVPGKYSVILSKKVDSSGNPPPPDADVGMLEADGALQESMPQQYTLPADTPLGADVPEKGGELQPFTIEG